MQNNLFQTIFSPLTITEKLCNTTSKTPDFQNECLFDLYSGFLPCAVLLPLCFKRFIQYSRDRQDNANQNPYNHPDTAVQRYLTNSSLLLLISSTISLIANTSPKVPTLHSVLQFTVFCCFLSSSIFVSYLQTKSAISLTTSTKYLASFLPFFVVHFGFSIKTYDHEIAQHLKDYHQLWLVVSYGFAVFGVCLSIFSYFFREDTRGSDNLFSQTVDKFSGLFFRFANNLVKSGGSYIPNGPYSINSRHLDDLVSCLDNAVLDLDTPRQEILSEETSDEQNLILVTPPKSVFSLLWNQHWIIFTMLGFMRLLNDVLLVSVPYLLGELVTLLESNENSPQVYKFGSIMISCLFASCILGTQYDFKMNKLGLKIRGSLVALLYRKLTSSINSGDNIINLFNTDVNKIKSLPNNFHQVWSLPLQIFFSLYLLYKQLGLVSFVGVLVTILVLFASRYLAKFIDRAQTKLLKAKDDRVSVMSSILENPVGMKMSGYETLVGDLVQKHRMSEVKQLSKIKYLDAGCVFFWASTPVIMSVCSFILFNIFGFWDLSFTKQNSELTLSRIFTTLAVINILVSPLNSLPWVITGFAESYASLKRFVKFMKVEDVNILTFYDNIADFYQDDSVTSVQNGTFSYPNSENIIPAENVVPVLKNLTLSLSTGQKLGVFGPVGCGKSSILKTLMAELNKISGQVRTSTHLLKNGIAYCPQKPWIFKGTISENITLFMEKIDPELVKECLSKVDLEKDLDFQVGESGQKLSGGQKVKLGMARALYHIHCSNIQLLLIDEPFGATDVQMHRKISSILKSLRCAVVCSTHNLKGLVRFVDRTVELSQDGEMIEVSEGVGKLEALGVLDRVNSSDEEVLRSGDNRSKKREKSGDSKKSGSEVNSDEECLLDDDMDELIDNGAVDKGVINLYISSMGWMTFFWIIVSLIFMQASKVATDFVIAMEHADNSNNMTKLDFTSITSNSTTFIEIYGGLGLANILFTLFRSFSFAYGGLVACRKIHHSLLKSCLYEAGLKFFENTSCGKLLNRFTSDLGKVDSDLPFIANILLANAVSTFATFVLSAAVFPPVLVIIGLLTPYYFYIFKCYRTTSRNIRRLVSQRLSPVMSKFQESHTGIATIRAYKLVPTFRRHFLKSLNDSQYAEFWEVVVNVWITIRLQIIAILIVASVILFSCLAHHLELTGKFLFITPLAIGLSLSYALTLSSSISGMCRTLAETERELVALERIKHYLDLPEDLLEPTSGLESDAPERFLKGETGCKIEFKNITIQYNRFDPPVLNNFTADIQPGECVGIVGKNGCGKTSLIKTLLRLIEPENTDFYDSGSQEESGRWNLAPQILIDHHDILTVRGQDLRKRISTIPQEPFLFEGSIRDNIMKGFETGGFEGIDDNVFVFPTPELLIFKNNLPDFNNYNIGVGGKNLSHGQKQLVAFMREIFKFKLLQNSDGENNTLVILDEPTAFVDSETEEKMCMILKSLLKEKATVLIIAHKEITIKSMCDRVIHLDRDLEL